MTKINNDHLKKKFFVCSWSWVLKNITQYLFCYGEKTPFEEVVMLKIDCNFSWHGNQVVTAWSTATVLYMYGCEQLHNEGPFSCRNLIFRLLQNCRCYIFSNLVGIFPPHIRIWWQS